MQINPHQLIPVLKILQITDLHIQANPTDTLYGLNTELCFRQVLKQAHTEHGPFDLIIISGDLTEAPNTKCYQRILQILQAYQTKTLCLPGNHDDFQMMQAILNDGLISCDKHLQLQSWQIICLNSQKPDSTVGELSLSELAFLEAQLTTHPNTPTLIILHHHCLNSDSLWLDTMLVTNSDALLKLINRHEQVKAISFGHLHQEINASHLGIGIYATPATCYQFQPQAPKFSLENSPPGYRVFELSEDGGLQTNCYRISN